MTGFSKLFNIFIYQNPLHFKIYFFVTNHIQVFANFWVLIITLQIITVAYVMNNFGTFLM